LRERSQPAVARGTIRRKEVAVRASLGATRWQLFSQFLVESLSLALIAAHGIAWRGVLLKGDVALLPRFLCHEADIRLNLPVLFFQLGVTVVAGVLCGCASGWRFPAGI